MTRFGANAVDVLISTELIEHVRDWRLVVHNFKQVVKPGGTLLITTRSPGFPYHSYPYDFWRYEPADFRALFADLDIEALEQDPTAPGVFLKARKPLTFGEVDTGGHTLHSVLTGRRMIHVRSVDVFRFRAGVALQAGGRRVRVSGLSDTAPPHARVVERSLVALNLSRPTGRGTMAVADHLDTRTRLHLGSGLRYDAEAVNVDVVAAGKPDVLHDFNQRPWPFPDNRFESVVMRDVLEHLDDTLAVVEEIHRVCKPGAQVHIVVPHFSSNGAFTDPTHKRLFSALTFRLLYRRAPAELLQGCLLPDREAADRLPADPAEQARVAAGEPFSRGLRERLGLDVPGVVHFGRVDRYEGCERKRCLTHELVGAA